MSAILSVRDLEKTFGSVVAARDITLDVPPQQTVGIIGANGAGKTTFVNMITGHLRPTKGSIRFEDRDITGLPSREITRLGISRSFQVAQIFPRSPCSRTCARRRRSRRKSRRRAHARAGAAAHRRGRSPRPRPRIELFRIAPYRDAPRVDAAAGRAQAARHRDGGGRRAARPAARRADQRHLGRGEVRPDGRRDVGAEDAAS